MPRLEVKLDLVSAINPFANKELTSQERIALRAEKKAYNTTANNRGVPSKECLLELAKAYENATLNLKAAETYEDVMNYILVLLVIIN